MRIEIHRWRMAIPVREDGRVAVGYDVRVILTDHGEYQDYPDATWSTSLSPGWARYEAWLAHEREAKRQMLHFLHEHCPETRELTEWPALWAYVDPDLAPDLHTVRFVLAVAPTTRRPASAGTAA